MPKTKEIKFAPCECAQKQKYNDQLNEKNIGKEPVERKPKKKVDPKKVFVMSKPKQKPKAKPKRKKRKRRKTV